MKNVPKKLHLFWFEDENPKPPFIDDLKQIYDNYKIKVWTLEDFKEEPTPEELRNKVNDPYRNLCPFVKKAMKDKDIHSVINYFKMKVLFENGGIAVDLNMMPVEKFSFDSDAKLFLGFEHRNIIETAFIACKRGHRFPRAVMEYYESLIHPDYVPHPDLIWTEILHALYPGLGSFKENNYIDDLQTISSHILSSKHEVDHTHYFQHKGHDAHSVNLAVSMIPLSHNKMVSAIKRKTESKTFDTINKRRKPWTVTVIRDAGYLDKELFDQITKEPQNVKVHLTYRNEILRDTLLKIHNVVSVTFGADNTKMIPEERIEIGNVNFDFPKKVYFTYKSAKGRVNFETYTNIYSRLLNYGVEGVLIHDRKQALKRSPIVVWCKNLFKKNEDED